MPDGETGDANATAAVMMALADMTNGKAVLAEMAVRLDDSQIVIGADIAQITLRQDRPARPEAAAARRPRLHLHLGLLRRIGHRC